MRSRRSMLAGAALLWAALLVCGCADDNSQSALHPAGPAASKIAILWWVMFVVLSAASVLVFVLLWIALRRRHDEHAAPPLGDHGFIIAGGIALPAVVTVGLLIYSLEAMTAPRDVDDAPVIQVIGHQFWWEVRYPDEQIITANEIYIPVGRPVKIELTAADVIHSLWVPNLAGKLDNVPGKTNVLWLQADRAGRYRGQCAEYCGVQHAWMALIVAALPEDEYQEWVQHRQRPVQPPTDPELEEGRQAYFRAGCHNCHAIAGTESVGRIGPDLTHMGARETIGAGLVPNRYGYLAGWVSNPQGVKPGNKMPPTYLTPRELHVLVLYLESLE